MDGSKFLQKNNNNLAHTAYDAIKKSISNGDINPGDLISESNIAAELGMSRTPVREALKMLAMEDFVVIKNGVGIIVKTFSDKEIYDMYQARNALELVAVESAIFHFTQAEIDDMRKHYEYYLNECTKSNTIDPEYLKFDCIIHDTIIEKTDNYFVKKAISSFVVNTKRAEIHAFKSIEQLAESSRQHLEVLKKIEEKDVDGAVETLRNHFKWCNVTVKAEL